MKKLIIAIPAFNEEANIATVIKGIREFFPPKKSSLILVVDDGSIDRTSKIAKNSGADIIVRHQKNRGVAQAYKTAIRVALSFGADIICTIDGDAQFYPEDIESLIMPIKRGEADLVIGSRFIDPNSLNKIPIPNRVFNKLMAGFVSLVSGKRFFDTESGFRAVSKVAAEDLCLLGRVSFSSDMIIDLAWKKRRITEVPVKVRYYDSRVSRVINSFTRYGFKSVCFIVFKILSAKVSLKSQEEFYSEMQYLLTPKSEINFEMKN